MNKFALLLLSWALFFVIDMTWIRVIMKEFYEEQMAALLREQMLSVHTTAGMFVWFLLVVGLFYFVLPLSSTLAHAFLYGALFGAVVYGVYDLTNFTTLKTWSLQLVFVDWAWGCFVNGLMATVLYLLNKHF